MELLTDEMNPQQAWRCNTSGAAVILEEKVCRADWRAPCSDHVWDLAVFGGFFARHYRVQFIKPASGPQ